MRSVLLLQRVIRGWSGREKFAWAKHNRAREIKEQRRLVLLAKESERRQRQQAVVSMLFALLFRATSLELVRRTICMQLPISTSRSSTMTYRFRLDLDFMSFRSY